MEHLAYTIPNFCWPCLDDQEKSMYTSSIVVEKCYHLKMQSSFFLTFVQDDCKKLGKLLQFMFQPEESQFTVFPPLM